MNNNLEFENEDPCPDSIEDNHPRTNYGEGYGGKESFEEAAGKEYPTTHEQYQYDAFIKGAKWMQEKMYSEAIEFAEWIRIKDFQTTSKDNWIGLDMKYYTTEELFVQFKKK